MASPPRLRQVVVEFVLRKLFRPWASHCPCACRTATSNLQRTPILLPLSERPRTTISPSLVMKDSKAWLAFGSMGGDQQDQWQLQFLLNRLVFDMPLQEAIEAPKFSSEHFPSFFAPHDFYLN